MQNKTFHQLKKGQGKWQLICFPYLGGYANSFFELANTLDEELEVWAANPPGHGGCSLNPLEDIDSVLDLYFTELREIIKPGCMFFGHSMGGIIAYFLAQRILESEEYTAKPNILVLSACNTPCDFKTKNYSNLPNGELIDQIISYDGIPDELIKEKSLLEYFLPVFRADFKVLETSAALDYKPLDIPAYFLWGENDKIVPIDSAVQWLKYFKQELKMISIEAGSHMFIHKQAGVVAKYLDQLIRQKAV